MDVEKSEKFNNLTKPHRYFYCFFTRTGHTHTYAFPNLEITIGLVLAFKIIGDYEIQKL